MIDYYMAPTPNAHKVTILLEELSEEYTVHKIDLQKNEQKHPDFIKMNPNGRIPVIIDNDGANGKTTVFESAAILYYLAEKHHGKFFGKNLEEKTKVMQWMMFQMSAVGPNFGNFHFGSKLEPKNPQYVERFQKESLRVISVLNLQLEQTEFLAGTEYTIADICTYPWIAAFYKNHPEWFSESAALLNWFKIISKRPAVIKAIPA